MKKAPFRPVVSEKWHRHVQIRKVGRSEVVCCDDRVDMDQRRPLAGRPAGTECGGSCTCS